MTTDNIIQTAVVKKYLNDIKNALDAMPVDAILEVTKVLNEARLNRRTVYIFGNGGSAATASHAACDFTKGANRDELPGLKAIALNDHLPLLTALANDESFDDIYARQLEFFVDEGDVVIGISVSGNSPNVLNGIKAARERGAVTIGFTSENGGALKDIVDIPVKVPLNNMEQAEDLHLLIEHVITTCLRVAPPDTDIPQVIRTNSKNEMLR